MKKAILLTLFCITSMIAFSQSEGTHLKFMGIELDGTINEFQEKLLKKGVTIAPDSKLLPNGMRSYKGSFSGEEADIVIRYNPTNKIVYGAKVMIAKFGEESTRQLMNMFEGRLDLKYGTDGKESKYEKDDYNRLFKNLYYRVDNGYIALYISSTGFSNSGKFYLHVQYHDGINDLMNYFYEMDDL